MSRFQVERPETAFSLRPRHPRRRQRAPNHLRWIRTLPCAICGIRRDIHAAHIRSASPRHGKFGVGIGEKPDDCWTVPLCSDHHLWDFEAQHQVTEAVFWREHRIDPFALALALWRASGDDELGCVILQETRQAQDTKSAV
jgi:hypothetical protein